MCSANSSQGKRALKALVNADGNGRQGGQINAAGEDAAAILPNKGGLLRGINDDGLALFNTHHGPMTTANEVNFHTKNL